MSGTSWDDRVRATHRQWQNLTGRRIQAAEATAARLPGARHAPYEADSLGLVDLAKERRSHEIKAQKDQHWLGTTAGVRLTAVRSEPALLRSRAPRQTAEDRRHGYRASLPQLTYHRRLQLEAEQSQDRPSRRVIHVSHTHVRAPTGLTAAYIKHTDHVYDALTPHEQCAVRLR